jgi:type VI secretion system protein ImpJ
MQELYGLLHQRGELLASLISQPSHRGIAEIADFLMLQTINRYEPLFAHLITTPMLHPERLYSICLNLAGDLSTFSSNFRRPQPYPKYLHDKLFESFEPLMAELRRAFTSQIDRNAISIELQDRQRGYRLAIINDKELFKSANFYLAANAQIPSETIRTRLPTQIKIGPVEKLQELVNIALPGIPITPLSVAPREIPFHAGFSYFQLDRNNEFWKQLEHSAGLGMHIAGDWPGLELEFWAIKG